MNKIERIGERVVFGKATERLAKGILVFAIAFFLVRFAACLIR
jgi:hypothetical protein